MTTWSKRATITPKTSEFYSGKSIANELSQSLFGQVKQYFLDVELPINQQSKKEYKLPTVIVIGDESSGKSSLLENITKCAVFPRDTKICTRCPIHVKMTNGPPEYKIEYQPRIIITSKHNISNEIVKIMGLIPTDVISDKPIIVHIQDTHIPTMEFIDLPGIRTYPESMAKQTISLVEKYISENSAIILCVIPATTTRLTSCQSIALIQQKKAERRSILVLTMCDRLLPENIEELLAKRILLTSDELKNCDFTECVGVVNRLHTDGVSLIENDDAENKWFNMHLFDDMPSEYVHSTANIKKNVSVQNLLHKMNVQYSKYIVDVWKPQIIGTIDQHIDTLKKQLTELNNVPLDIKAHEESICSVLDEYEKPEQYFFFRMPFIKTFMPTHIISHDVKDDMMYDALNEKNRTDEQKALMASYLASDVYFVKRMAFLTKVYDAIDNTFDNDHSCLIDQMLSYVMSDLSELPFFKNERYSRLFNNFVAHMHAKFQITWHNNKTVFKEHCKTCLTHHRFNGVTMENDIFMFAYAMFESYCLDIYLPSCRSILVDLTKEDFIEDKAFVAKRQKFENDITSLMTCRNKIERLNIEQLNNQSEQQSTINIITTAVPKAQKTRTKAKIA